MGAEIVGHTVEMGCEIGAVVEIHAAQEVLICLARAAVLGREQAKPLLSGVRFYDSPYDATEGADALVIVTEWDVYRALDLDRIHQTMKSPTVVDLRNIYRPDEMAAKGFSYSSIGRPPVRP
jgi:UDP-glucose 6-dehydrogenase